MRNKVISSLAGVAFGFAASGLAFAADMAVKAPPAFSPITGTITTHTHFTDNILRVGPNYQFH